MVLVFWLAVAAVSSTTTVGGEAEPAIRNDVIDAKGKRNYEPTWESLAQHGAAPEWYEDAVFGIYFHWGIYSVPAYGGEKYYMKMYKPDQGVYKYHCKTYGNPTEFGYHDLIPMFKAEKWDPNRWAELFKHAGADFAGSIAEHGDGFAMWDTEYDEYNAMDMGPHRDIVGEMSQAVRNHGMKVVTTFHNLKWYFYDNGRTLCPEGVGVNNPEYSGLYGPVHNVGDPISESFKEEGYNKFIEVIDKYQPDQLQIDGGTCSTLGEERLKKMLAYYFNAARKQGKEVAVSRGNDRNNPDVIPITCAIANMECRFPDVALDAIRASTWQATTRIPDFSYCYVASQENKTPAQIEDSVNALVDGMVTVKCTNGVTLLSIGPKPDGTLPDAVVKILNKLGDWMRVNKEALYGGRCWFPCAAGTLRFTQKGPFLYAIALEKPEPPVVIPRVTPMPGSAIRMLGSDENLAWHQDGGNAVIDELPDPLPCDYAWIFKIRFDRSMEKSQKNSDDLTLSPYPLLVP